MVQVKGVTYDNRALIAYARVSSSTQREELNRQIEHLRTLFPGHKLIYDIGSGLSFKRKGLHVILDLAIKGLLEEVVVVHRDRLCRFGFDLIDWIIQRKGGRIRVIDSFKVRDASPEVELAEDVLSIVTVFGSTLARRRQGVQVEYRPGGDVAPLPASYTPPVEPVTTNAVEPDCPKAGIEIPKKKKKKYTRSAKRKAKVVLPTREELAEKRRKLEEEKEKEKEENDDDNDDDNDSDNDNDNDNDILFD
jgi:predicted site-specific integrase-resolvase